MNSNTIIPIAVVITALATAGIIFGLGLNAQPEVTSTPPPKVIYVNQTVSEFFEGTQEVKQISSE